MQGRIAIPIDNADGNLVVYAGRWPDDSGWPEGEGKYRFPDGFHKSFELYKLHRMWDLELQIVVIVEGFFDAIRLDRFGIHAIATMGSSLSEEQAELVLDLVGPRGQVLILFDNDEAGRKGTARAIELLAGDTFVRAPELPREGMQPEDLTDGELQELLS